MKKAEFSQPNVDKNEVERILLCKAIFSNTGNKYTKKTELLPSEVQSFQMKGTQDYHNLLQILQEDVQKIDHQIRENNEKISQIEAQKGEVKELLAIEKKDIQPQVMQLQETLKSLPKTKENLSKRKLLEEEKKSIQAKSRELKAQGDWILPKKIEFLMEQNGVLQSQKETLLKNIQKVATNPVAFCQTMKDKISGILSQQSFGESRLPISKQLEEQSRFYSQSRLKALQVAILPIDETKFNIVGRGPSEGKIKSNLIPSWSDGGGTYNEIF